MNDVIPHELTVDEIKQIVEMFGDYAFFYKRGGYDGVEISGAHGYLIAEFMSTYANKRSDEYGRTLECTTSPMSYPPAYLADYAKEIKSVVNKSERICLMDELKIKSLTDAKVVEIQEDGIIVNKDGENIKLVCDTVVLASLYENLKDRANVQLIGDANGIANGVKACREGFLAGCKA
jgi:hypothetical protein